MLNDFILKVLKIRAHFVQHHLKVHITSITSPSIILLMYLVRNSDVGFVSVASYWPF